MTPDPADQVDRIELIGAPRAVLVDDEALGAASSPLGSRVRALLLALGIEVVPVVDHVATLRSPTVAVLGRDHPPVPSCHAWYVGAGKTPAWMHPTAGARPRTTAHVLSLLGTGFAQERAGAAFRAAGAGAAVPASTAYDGAAILRGITTAVAAQPSSPHRPQPPSQLATGSVADLLRRSAAALERCCAPNGAIAAAPAAAGGPGYWFFWQRDAAHAAVALHALARFGPDDVVRRRAARCVERYVDFVAGLGPALARTATGIAASRCTMAGEPVGHYGDPQHDGPAATALALLTVVDDPRSALDLARPFLDHLRGTGRGYDLWELTQGRSFHALNLSRRALRRAAAVAALVADPAAADFRRDGLLQSAQLDEFRDGARGGLVHSRQSQPAWFEATSRLDMSAIGSVLLCYDVSDDVLNVDDPDVAATLRQLATHFGERWPVNSAWRSGGHLGGGIGRFPEDCNDGLGSTGGNPWPVTTLWAAQYHLRRVERAAHLGVVGERATDLALAEGYLSFVLAHCDPDAMSEQIDGLTGLPRGAGPLAWAHAELVMTLVTRAR